MSILWPFLVLLLVVIAGYLLIYQDPDLSWRWPRCAACGERAPSWRMRGPICGGCVLDALDASRVDWDAPDPTQDVPPAFRGIL